MFELPALDLDDVVLDGPAGPARGFQLFEQVRQVVSLGRQSADEGDLFALFAFFDREHCGLFFRRDAGRRLGRTGAFLFEFAAAITAWGPVEFSAFEEAHGSVEGLGRA